MSYKSTSSFEKIQRELIHVIKLKENKTMNQLLKEIEVSGCEILVKTDKLVLVQGFITVFKCGELINPIL